MRKIAAAGFLAGLLFVILTGLSEAQVAGISPAQPRLGGTITLTYDASVPGAVLKDKVHAIVLVMRNNQMPLLLEVPMKADGGTWTGTFSVSDSDAQAIAVKFVSGDASDDNNGNPLHAALYSGSGEPVPGAHVALAAMYLGMSLPDIKVAKNLDLARSECEKELALDHGNVPAISRLWSIDVSQHPGSETLSRIRTQLDSIYEARKSDEAAVALLLPWFDQTGGADTASAIRADAIAKHPHGKLAESVRASAIFATRDAGERARLVEQFLADFPASNSAKNMREILLMAYGQTSQVAKAMKLAASMDHPDPMSLNSIAWNWAEKGVHVAEAEALAKRAVDALRNPDPAARPSYMSESTWMQRQKEGLGMVLDTYAFTMMKQQQYTKAEPVAAEAYRLSQGLDAEVTERYVSCLVADKKYQRAMDIAAEAVATNQANERLVADYRTAYTHVKGSDAGFQAVLDKAHTASIAALREKLMGERINTPAIDFTLRGSDGSTVTLSSLKGKVVVIDFWATWCGPCKASFPSLQEIYDRYKSNPSVVILALNTWERTRGEEREKTVKQFIADNQYTFPVLYDSDFVSKYGVEGIPTKFVVDKEGTIQFKSIGFENAAKMKDELTTEIDMLLDDSFYKKAD